MSFADCWLDLRADGIDARDEPVAAHFDELSFEIMAVGIGLPGKARYGAKIDASIRRFRADDDMDFVEGDGAFEAGASGHQRLLQFGAALNVFVYLRDAFAVDEDVRREERKGFVDAGDARDVSLTGLGSQTFSERRAAPS